MAEIRHIAIAGAGVVGLACALELHRRGIEVTVFEAGAAMREASWAAGGMLAVDDPENPAALHPLSCYSSSLYESFLAEITRLSGLYVPFRTHQTIQVIPSGHMQHSAAGIRLTLREAQQYVPGLAAATGSYLLLEEASLDPRDLCAALPRAVGAIGVNVREHDPVEGVSNSGRRILVTTTRTSLEVDAFLNCSGAWSSAVSALASHAQRRAAAITPRKGQMMVVAAPAGPLLTSVVRSPDVYLIPRSKDRIAIGATVEDAGFSKTVDPAALDLLRRRAAALWPPIANAPVIESWAGLRPATEDGLPLLGREESTADDTAGDDRRWIAAGHYRNGILLAPGTAACMAALILGEPPPMDMSAFAPYRKRSPAACDNHFAPAL